MSRRPTGRLIVLASIFVLTTGTRSPTHAADAADAPDTGSVDSSFVFPLDTRHNHAPGIVEFPSGDLLVSWFRGSGERTADDVAVYGAWKRAGAATWSEPFVMADQPGFPDCNTCMHLDDQNRLWLFWPTIIANSWESCLTRYQVADLVSPDRAPRWARSGLVLLKPDDFSEDAQRVIGGLIAEHFPDPLPSRLATALDQAKAKLTDKLYQRLGWQPRCKPTVLPSGRILLPLYTDTFSIGIMAISDDGGDSWYASKPLLGFGNIQPSVVRRNDGTLVAYMRDNGPTGRVFASESGDDGITWTVARATEIANPGSGLDAVRLRNGNWVLVGNDTPEGRNRLTLFLSDDEGASWKWKRSIESHDSGSYHYPAIIQSADDDLHLVYSYFVDGGKSIRYAKVSQSWIRDADH